MRKKIRRTILLLLAAVVLVAVAQNFTLTVARYDVASIKIPAAFEGYKILQLSDLHSAEFGEGNQKLYQKIRKLDPDVILATGDMLNSTQDDGAVFLSLAEELAGVYPIYYIFGNHEMLVWEYHEEFFLNYIDRLTQLGVHVMHNQRVELTRGDEKIYLYGYDMPLRYYNSRSYLGETGGDLCAQDLRGAIGMPGEGVYTVLAAHHPAFSDVYAGWGADLTFAGHLHGGVVRIPFVGGLLSPDLEFFPEQDRGMYEMGDGALVVSAGIGNSVIQFRLFNPPQLVLVTLHAPD